MRKRSLDSKTLKAKLRQRLGQAGQKREEIPDPALSQKLPQFAFAQTQISGPDRFLKPGQTVSISPLTGDVELAALLKKLSPALWLQIPVPIPDVTFHVQEQIRVRYWTAEQIYRFESEVVEVSGDAQENLSISRPSEGVVWQRSKSKGTGVRFSFRITEARESHLREQLVRRAKTKETNTTGMAFETNLSLALGDHLEAKLKLPDAQKPVKVEGRVVRVSPVKGSNPTTNLVAVQFFPLPPEEHNRLLLFVAEHQSEEGASDVLWVG